MRWLLLLSACLYAARADEYEFWEACETGDTKEMENLLETASDIDLNYPDEDGRTPLLLAAGQPAVHGLPGYVLSPPMSAGGQVAADSGRRAGSRAPTDPGTATIIPSGPGGMESTTCRTSFVVIPAP